MWVGQVISSNLSVVYFSDGIGYCCKNPGQISAARNLHSCRTEQYQLWRWDFHFNKMFLGHCFHKVYFQTTFEKVVQVLKIQCIQIFTIVLKVQHGLVADQSRTGHDMLTSQCQMNTLLLAGWCT